MRQTNFELLRLISMFMVLIVHSNFQALGTPTNIDILNEPTINITRIILQSFTLVCVNIFILISGWFGIKFSFRGILQLLFQTFFFLFSIYFICIFFKIENFSFEGLGKCMMLNNGTWFIKSYLCLYIISPVLNKYIEQTSRRNYKITLTLYFLFQLIWGWGSKGVTFFEEGFSPLSFIGLYLLSRYMKIYGPKISLFPKRFDIIMYILLSLITSFFLFISIKYEFKLYYKFWAYNNPFIILSSVFLFLYFSKINIYNKFINNISKSCLSVYLLHFIIWNKVITPIIRSIDYTYDPIIEVMLILIVLILFYSIAIIFDKIRIFIWNIVIQTKLFNNLLNN